MAAKLVKVSVFLCVSWDYVTFASVKPETRHDYIYAVPVGTYCRIFYLWTLDGTDFRTRRPKDPGLDKGRRSGLYPDADVEDFPHTAAQYRGAGADFRCRAGGGIRPRGIPVDYLRHHLRRWCP